MKTLQACQSELHRYKEHLPRLGRRSVRPGGRGVLHGCVGIGRWQEQWHASSSMRLPRCIVECSERLAPPRGPRASALCEGPCTTPLFLLIIASFGILERSSSGGG